MISDQQIASIRQHNDFTDEYQCLEEMLLLREAIKAISDHLTDTCEIREILYNLENKGVQLGHRYKPSTTLTYR